MDDEEELMADGEPIDAELWAEVLAEPADPDEPVLVKWIAKDLGSLWGVLA